MLDIIPVRFNKAPIVIIGDFYDKQCIVPIKILGDTVIYLF
nr:hypothetical protein [uncultured Acetatifactor sp.]